MLPLHFRPFATADREAVQTMMQTFYTEEHLPFSLENWQKTLQRLGQPQPMIDIFIFESEDQIAGYALVAYFWSNEYGGIMLTIDEIFVLPQHRQKGIAKTFLQFLKQNPPKDVVILALEVQKSNTQALRLYQKIGFTDTKRHHLRLPI